MILRNFVHIRLVRPGAVSRMILLAAISLLGSGCARFPSVASIPSRPEGLVREKVTFKPEPPERWELPNGLIVYYRFNDELPSVKARLYFPGGTIFVPRDRSGLAEATGVMLREGAYVGTTPDALDKTLDDLAAGVETSYGGIYGSLGCSSLSEDFEKVFGIAFEIIQRPAFDAARFELWKKNTHQAIERRRDNPAVMISMVIGDQVYGADSPYAAYVTHQSLNAVTLEGIREYYRKNVQPKGSRLVVTGAITKGELNRLLEKTFGKWKAAADAQDPPAMPEPPALGTQRVYVIERDFDQSTVAMAHVGPPMPHPEIPEMGVFNRLYGSGGFGNVLMQEIRTKLGLAYEVGGGISPGVGAGLFEVGVATRNEEVINAILKVLEVTKNALTHPMPATQVEGAKASVERAFVFKFASPDQVVERAVQQEILKFPPDYDAKYLSKVEAMTPEIALQVGQKWIKPGSLSIVVVTRVPAEQFAAAFAPRGVPVYRVTFDEKPHLAGEVVPK